MTKWPMTGGHWRVFLALDVLASLVMLSGCGYHVAGHNSTLPKAIHVVAVPPMENKTTAYRIEQKLTAATIHEFLAKTRYKVVSDPAGSDAVLTAKVLSMEALPLLYNTTTTTAGVQTAQATAMLVIMKCEVTFTDRLSQKVLYHADNFVFRNEYELSTTNPNSQDPQQIAAAIQSFFQESDPALDRMAQDFASRLVTAVVENY